MNPYLRDTTLPIGSVVAFAGNITPPHTPPPSSPPNSGYPTMVQAWGWMVCNGGPEEGLNPSEYPELFMAIGYLYGKVGEHNFKLPDLRGMFLRGAEGSDLVQEDAVNEDRTKAADGEDTGVGSTQNFAIQRHVHTYTMPEDPKPFNQGEATSAAVQSAKADTDTSQPIKAKADASLPDVNLSKFETRPTNTLVYYIIKYTLKLPDFSI